MVANAYQSLTTAAVIRSRGDAPCTLMVGGYCIVAWKAVHLSTIFCNVNGRRGTHLSTIFCKVTSPCSTAYSLTLTQFWCVS